MSYKDQFNEAKKVGGVKSLSPEFVEFEKAGVVVLGKFMGAADVDGKLGTGTYKQYLFETDDRLAKFALGAATDREVWPSMKVGDIYRIEYLGQEKISGGRKVNKFKVEHMASDSVDEEGTDKSPTF